MVQSGGAAGKGTRRQPEDLIPILEPHMVEGKQRHPQLVLSPLRH